MPLPLDLLGSGTGRGLSVPWSDGVRLCDRGEGVGFTFIRSESEVVVWLGTTGSETDFSRDVYEKSCEVKFEVDCDF